MSIDEHPWWGLAWMILGVVFGGGLAFSAHPLTPTGGWGLGDTLALVILLISAYLAGRTGARHGIGALGAMGAACFTV